MVLPILGSFLASAFFPGSPLIASAIGSGIGSLMQGDDLDEALATGLFSFMGGKLLGGMSGIGKAGAAAANPAQTVLGGKTVPVEALKSTVAKPIMGFGPENFTAAPAGTGMLSTPAFNQLNAAAQANLAKQGIMGTLKQGAITAMANPMMAAGVAGGAMIPSLMKKQNTGEEKSDYVDTETLPVQDNITFPQLTQANYTNRTGYRPGIDPEHNYGFSNPLGSQIQTRVIANGGLAKYAKPSMMGFSTKLSSGGLAALAEGGMPEEEMVEAPMDAEMGAPNEKDVIVNAVNAIKGNIPEDQAPIVLAQFVQQYGEEALQDLVEDVRNGEYDNIGGKADGMVEGGGDGMSDSVPATIDGEEDLLVSKDEYVIDAPTVAMIGNGSSEAGAKKLDNMREEVRKAATGSRVQPRRIDAENIMGAALA